MFARIQKNKDSRAEAESPFWISFSDLMLALMSLFLVIMTVMIANISVKEEESTEKGRKQRESDINFFMKQLRDKLSPKGITVNVTTYTMTMPELRFGNNEHTLSSEVKEKVRKKVAGKLKPIFENKYLIGSEWIKRINVEGYASKTGSFLYNMELSLLRGLEVYCGLYEERESFFNDLDNKQLALIKRFFSTAGFSSNSQKENPEESRRVEFRIEFWTFDEIDKKEISLKDRREILKQLNDEMLESQFSDIGKCGSRIKYQKS